MADNRAAVYFDEEVNKWVYRASSLGSCFKALVAARKGMEPEQFDSVADEAMAEGVLHEEHVLRRLEASGRWEIMGKGQTEVEVDIPEANAVIRGHIDETAKDVTMHQSHGPPLLGVEHVVEVKTMSETRFRLYQRHGIDAFPNYAIQLSVYMMALNMPGLLVVKNRNTGHVVETVFPEPPIPPHQIINRVKLVNNAAQLEQLPPCDDSESFYCRFAYLHDSNIGTGEPTAPLQSDPDFEALILAYHERRMEEDTARWARDELRGKILERMGVHETAEGVPGFDIARKVVTKRTLDNRKVKRMLTQEQVEKATYETPTEYLIVSPVREKASSNRA